MRILEEGDVRVVVLGGFVVGFFLFLRFGGGGGEVLVGRGVVWEAVGGRWWRLKGAVVITSLVCMCVRCLLRVSP